MNDTVSSPTGAVPDAVAHPQLTDPDNDLPGRPSSRVTVRYATFGSERVQVEGELLRALLARHPSSAGVDPDPATDPSDDDRPDGRTSR